MFGVDVESCILHMKLCSMFKSRAVFWHKKTMFGVLVECSYFAHKTMFGV